jgi:small subunit ribosomal protein S3
MIEREFVAQKNKEYYIKQYILSKLGNAEISAIKLKKIPLGEKIIINTSKPSLVVGSKGSNIKDLTKTLKQEFKLENPQIEINEIRDIYLDANIVAGRIASYLERLGSARFKSIGHKIMENIMNSGALGVEIVISGKIPSARAKSWRFYQGYIKKSGDVAVEGVRKATTHALLKSGIIGIKVSIMPPDVLLPDRMKTLEEVSAQTEEVKEEKKETKKKREGKRKEPGEKKKKSKEHKENEPVKEATEKVESRKATKKKAEVPAEDAEANAALPEAKEEAREGQA